MGGVETQVHQASSDSEDAFLGGLSEHQPHGDDPWAVTVTLEERPVILSIDTGAKVTVISEEIWKEIEQPSLSPPRHRLRAPDAKPIKFHRTFSGVLTLGNHQAESVLSLA